ncbi:hypothetical protein [Glycomyces arizonensis]|uniref:hypothetical protein n=1 Tax=Glycomyces arizonensis TaxID=256035 RepID=UPI000416AB15|nr:hypothetical protein [Glycomyces arizonensis]
MQERLGPRLTVLGTITANLAAYLKGLALSVITLSKPLVSRLASAAITATVAVISVAAIAVDRSRPLAARLSKHLEPAIDLLKRAAAVAAERSRPLTSWVAQRIEPWNALLKDLAAVAGHAARRAGEAAADLARPLVTRVTDRFGVRVTVIGAATAVFVGSTGSTAWAITAMDVPPGETFTEQTYDDTTALTIAGIAEDASSMSESIADAQSEADAAAEAQAAEEAKKAEAAEPDPVGGLSDAQMDNAVAIIEAGKDEGLDRDGWAVALSTAMQESKFRNYANVNVPESYDYEYQAEGSDHDSVGLFQQRPSSGWGTVEELMDPKTSASRFYESLKNVDDWEDMPVTIAAQTVQVSAFPDAYAQWEDLAWDIIESYEDAHS